MAVKVAPKGAKEFSKIFSVSYDQLAIEDGFNARKMLDQAHIDSIAASMAYKGMVEPMRVRKARPNEDQSKFYIVNGHTRYAAIQKACDDGADSEMLKNKIQVIFEDGGDNNIDNAIHQILLNSGKPLDVVEQSEVVSRMTGLGVDIAEIARRLGKTPRAIQKLKDFHKTPEFLKNAVRAGVLSQSAAVELYKAPEEAQKKLVEKVTVIMEKKTQAEKYAPEPAKPDAKTKAKGTKPVPKPAKKQKPAISVKDVQKAAGKQASFTRIEIEELRKKVVAIGNKLTHEPIPRACWDATIYGLDVLLQKEELKMNKFDNVIV